MSSDIIKASVGHAGRELNVEVDQWKIVMFCVQFEASGTPGKGAVGVRYSEINNLFMPNVLPFCRSLCTMLDSTRDNESAEVPRFSPH